MVIYIYTHIYTYILKTYVYEGTRAAIIGIRT